MIDPWLWLGFAILLAFTIETITGFGSIVIALALGALMLPIPQLLPVLVPLSVIMSGYLTWQNRHHIDWHRLSRLILPLMLTGTITGYLLMPWLGDSGLEILLGCLIVWFAAKELRRMFGGHDARPHGIKTSRGIIFIAGVTQGLFASGGPLLVYALAGIRLDKSRIRATLVTVWLTLNVTLTVLFLLDGRLIANADKIAWYLPMLVIGVMVGDFLHHRLDEELFRRAVYGVLLVTGILLVLRAIL
ncbi:sulfite exporter TauE/SafE family protein [Marinobacter sp. CHS3-4]|uniref:sulfite exporter TauE/SafE family protein n=1 Tax=Marinobacter sp. CHS3-4 TaxID=3045174 RepID=UPI0024B61D2F|nr:sulfite exporter TauE/SafE family protein [Marinobacter sp. CHS3-4]MDI9243736.1 sulfite exporter TauE/SafE family protein [Marinobacter sp. CHS3-4]